MRIPLKRFLLEVVVFVCGAVVMIFEIVGSRVLGPYLGTSTFTWTSLIGVILGSLSIGYWLGGRLADRKPSLAVLSWIVFLAGIFILGATLFKDILLKNLPALISGLRGQSVVSSVMIFAPASLLLGMVSPYAVKLRITSLAHSGTTVGNLYAISTVGSIAGTFFAGFYLIPSLGTNQVMFSLTIILAALSLLLFVTALKTRNSLFPIILLALTVYLSIAYYQVPRKFLDLDTQYNRVWIYDTNDPLTGRPIRFMRINNESSSAMFLDSNGLVFPYANYFRLAEHFRPGFSKSLLLGGGAYTFPRFFLDQYPQAELDVVEIDPDLTAFTRQHFDLPDSPRMKIFHEDARTFINQSSATYDVIYVDVFKSLYALPWHLTSLEAVQAMHRLLNENGLVLVNLISSIGGSKSEFLSAEVMTFRRVFPEVRIFAVDDPLQFSDVQSIILVAFESPFRDLERAPSESLLKLLQHEITSSIPESSLLLTDNHAPVDNLINKALP